MQQELKPLNSFTLPGGGVLNAFLHQARTVCRRAERVCWALKREEPINDHLMVYVNRLSDHLFVQSRWVAKRLERARVPVGPRLANRSARGGDGQAAGGRARSKSDRSSARKPKFADGRRWRWQNFDGGIGTARTAQAQIGPMANFVYLIGDPVTRKAAVVDPAWDVDTIVKWAERYED